MALSTELREALASRHRPRLREQLPELPLPDHKRRSLNEQQPERNQSLPDDHPNDNPDDCALAALPPPSPDWSHLLCGRPQEAASAVSAHMALLAVGCRLSISPTTDMLREAARCHSAGAVRTLLVRCYGERGLAAAYQLVGREQPPQVGEGTNVITNG